MKPINPSEGSYIPPKPALHPPTLITPEIMKEELKTKKTCLDNNISNFIKTFEEETGLIVSQVLINRSCEVNHKHNFNLSTHIIME